MRRFPLYFFLILFLLFPQLVFAFTSQKSPTASADIVAGWSNLAYVYASEDNRASATATTAIMAATGFGFEIPTEATIRGIRIDLEGQGSSSTASRRRIVCGPTKNGTSLAGDNGTALTPPNGTDGVVTWEEAGTGLWGTTWSVAEVNASTFGVLIQPSGTTGYSRKVDQVQVTIYYTMTTAHSMGADGQSSISILVTSSSGGFSPVAQEIFNPSLTVPAGSDFAGVLPTSNQYELSVALLVSNAVSELSQGNFSHSSIQAVATTVSEASVGEFPSLSSFLVANSISNTNLANFVSSFSFPVAGVASKMKAEKKFAFSDSIKVFATE
jgi:hypothetical protein